jgi:hypothetical protein
VKIFFLDIMLIFVQKRLRLRRVHFASFSCIFSLTKQPLRLFLNVTLIIIIIIIITFYCPLI